MDSSSLSSSSKSASQGSFYHRNSIIGLYKLSSGNGNVIFTGPDGNGNQKTRILSPAYVGNGRATKESTGNLSYLWRAAKDTPHPRPKSCTIGEIGWHSRRHMDRRLLESRQQITLGEFRGQCEDRYTHRLQNPWYPKKPRPKSHQTAWLSRGGQENGIPDDLKQVPIRQTSSAHSKAQSTIGPLQSNVYRKRPVSPSSSSSSSYRIPNYRL